MHLKYIILIKLIREIFRKNLFKNFLKLRNYFQSFSVISYFELIRQLHHLKINIRDNNEHFVFFKKFRLLSL